VFTRAFYRGYKRCGRYFVYAHSLPLLLIMFQVSARFGWGVPCGTWSSSRFLFSSPHRSVRLHESQVNRKSALDDLPEDLRQAMAASWWLASLADAHSAAYWRVSTPLHLRDLDYDAMKPQRKPIMYASSKYVTKPRLTFSQRR